MTPSALPRLSVALGYVLAHFSTGCLGVPPRVEGPVGLGQPGQGGSATLASISLSSLAAETWWEPPCMTPATARRGREGWHRALLCRAPRTQCSPNLSGSPGLGAQSTGAARVPWMALADGAGVPATLVPRQEGPAGSRHLPAEDTPSCRSSGFRSWKAPRR